MAMAVQCRKNSAITLAVFVVLSLSACIKSTDVSEDVSAEVNEGVVPMSADEGELSGPRFTKLGSDGNALAIQSAAYDVNGSEESGEVWDCVQDNTTGIVWEVKSGGNNKGDKGQHNARDRYNWYNWYSTDAATNTGDVGYANNDGPICSGYDPATPRTYCNTQAYVARVNTAGWCGYHDWRLPTVDELNSIVTRDRVKPAIEAGYFFNTQSYWYWTSSSYAGSPSYAWGVNFVGGKVGYNYKHLEIHVRMVRGGQ